jgi:SAM-dependent MidA family methyltransferase
MNEINHEHSSISNELRKIVEAKILVSKNQVITFSDYMSTVLYYPDLGFYSNCLQKFGEHGHFFTACSIGKVFAKSMAKQIVELFNFGLPQRNILEIGAGNGDLAINILQEIGNQVDKFEILELNDRLIAEQKSKLYEAVPEYFAKVQWLKDLPNQFVGVVIANELLDAIACDRVLIDKHGEEIVGLGVGLEDGIFVDKKYELSEQSLGHIKAYGLAYDNYNTEINIQIPPFINSLANAIKQGAIIFVDYGCSRKEYYSADKYLGRIRGFFNHRVWSNLYEHLGLMDITTDVDFTLVAQSALNSGMDLIGYVTQGSFIMNAVPEVFNNQQDNINHDSVKFLHDLQTLVSPVEMGAIFKVMGLSKNIDQDDWLGFCHNDISYRL